MALLDPAEIKDEKKEREIAQQRRITSLNEAEADANRRLNIALENEKNQKERARAEAEEGVPVLETKKTILQAEVTALEARKTAALQPIDKIKEETEAQRIENNQQGELIRQKSAQLARDHETLLEKIEAVNDQAQDNAATKTKLDSRAKGITESEAEIKRSAEELGNKWVEFHATVLKKDSELKAREHKVQIDTKANEVFATQLLEREQQIEKDRRAVADGYATLERATKEIERKKKNG